MSSHEALAFSHASCDLIHLEIRPSMYVVTIKITKSVKILLCYHY